MPAPFLYPDQPHVRRHGPVYTAYESYRPWLRDEFSIALARYYDTSLYEKLLGLPDSLPDLAAKRPRENLKPEGVRQSFHARLKRGELPSVY